LTTLAPSLSATLAALILWNGLAAAEIGRVAPHPADREALVLKFSAPAGPGAPSVSSDRDGMRPIQALPDGSRLVVLSLVPAGVARTIEEGDAVTSTAAANSGPMLRESRDAVSVIVHGRELLAFNFRTIQPPRPEIDPIYARSGYIDPIRTRTGVVVSEAFARLPPRHEHLYGMWSAWLNCEFEGRKINFWSPMDRTTQIRCEGVSEKWQGPAAAGFTAVNVFYDRSLSPEKPVLRETWRVAAYQIPGDPTYDIFDVSLHQVCAGESPLTVKQSAYGGFAMRLPESFQGDPARFMVSTGETDRAKANQAQLRWIYLGASRGEDQAGLAILSHPTNFRAPQRVRLHPTTAYFVFCPASAGDFEIAPAMPYDAHYRAVVFDGPPERDRIERLWQAFASVPPLAAQ
jgi:hypothetical protein